MPGRFDTLQRALKDKLIQTLEEVDRRLKAMEHWRLFPETEGEHPALKWAKRSAVAAVGVIIIVAGVLMLVLPGPGIIAIVLGLTLLAAEFAWARRMLKKITTWSRHALRNARS